MLSRRAALCAISALLGKNSIGKAQEADWQAVLRETLNTENSITLGRLLPPPSSNLWVEAREQLVAAAQNRNPYNMARYFLTSLPSKFQTAWPEPNPARPTLANPIIVLFFLATNTRPEGDRTAWCAAFMNWCLKEATPSIAGTRSAASQSFLRWGDEVWNKSERWPPRNARRGDVAVFTLKSDPRHGHVAFYDEPTPRQPSRINILGGNQFDNSGGIHSTYPQSTYTEV